MSQEETEEWEIEILAYIKGKENADNAATEILATLINSPYTYFDIKITPYKPNTKEKLRITAEHHQK
jgi:adenosine deaminase